MDKERWVDPEIDPNPKVFLLTMLPLLSAIVGILIWVFVHW